MTYIYLVTAEVKPGGDWKVMTGMWPVCAFLDKETADQFVVEVRAEEAKRKHGVFYDVQAIPIAGTVEDLAAVVATSYRRAIALGGVTVNQQAKEAK